MDYEQIIFKEEGPLARISLNRPDKLNAYTPDMGDEIIHAFRRANLNDDISSIAFLGVGKSFCAGADRNYLLGDKLSKSGLKIGEDEFISSFVSELSSSKKILIAGLKGSCVGIGITMVLPFDIRIAETNSLISFPFIKLGILPGLASTYFLRSLVGPNKAKEIILTNAKLTADQANAIGLVNEVVSDGAAEARINEIASSFGRMNQNLLFAAKEAFQINLEAEVESAIKIERNLLKNIKK
jgi:2-(1,2-epoxy-1,2-dihydrophenyl)acetyl-CoA isomerase